MLPFNSIVSTRVWSKLCSTSMLNVEAKSSCEPALAASTSATVRSIVSSTTPGSMTIIGLTSKLADCITGVPPSTGIACTQTDTVSPIALWSTGSSGIFSLGTSMWTEKLPDSVALITPVLYVPNLTFQRLVADEKPAVSSKAPSELPKFWIVASKLVSSPGVTY